MRLWRKALTRSRSFATVNKIFYQNKIKKALDDVYSSPSLEIYRTNIEYGWWWFSSSTCTRSCTSASACAATNVSSNVSSNGQSDLYANIMHLPFYQHDCPQVSPQVSRVGNLPYNRQQRPAHNRVILVRRLFKYTQKWKLIK